MAPGQVNIRRLVRLARRLWATARLAEAVLLGLAAGGGTLAAAVLSGASVTSLGAGLAGAVSALLCALTWLAEGRRTPGEMARRIDRRLERGGAFLTAFECEQREAGPLAAALVERVGADVGRRDVRRAVSPPSIAFLAAPLFAAALVLFAVEHGPGAAPAGARPALRALATELGTLAAGAESEPLTELAAEASELAGGELAPERLASRLRRLRGDLGRVRDTAGAQLERADELAESALAALTGAPIEPDAAPPHGAARGGMGASDLVRGAPGSTMGGSPSRNEDAPEVAPADRPDSAGPVASEREAGVLAGRWWDERYDAIVLAWVESEGARRE